MTNILNLAKNFQQTSEAEVHNTNEVAKNAIKQLENDLIGQLNNASENIGENIQTQQSTLIRALAIKMYSLPTIVGTIILVMLSLANLWVTWDAQSQYQEMKEWKASAEIYKAQSNKIKLFNCKTPTGESKPCIETDPKYKEVYGNNPNLKIIKE